jgi:hypothetical protein
MTLCQKNQGTAKFKQKPVTVGGRTTYRTPFQNGTDRQSYLERCLEKDRIATHILRECET